MKNKKRMKEKEYISNFIQDKARRTEVEIRNSERDDIDDEGSEKRERNRSHNVLGLTATSEFAEKSGGASKFARQINNKQRAGLREGFGAMNEIVYKLNNNLIQKKSKPLPLGRGHRRAMPFFLSQKL